mgnify:CR=1 FL=1
MKFIRVPLSRIGAVIGPKGKTKRKLEELSGCVLNIDSREGVVEISSSNKNDGYFDVYYSGRSNTYSCIYNRDESRYEC